MKASAAPAGRALAAALVDAAVLVGQVGRAEEALASME